MMITILKSTVMLLTLLLQVHSMQSQIVKAPYVPGQLIVKFKEGKSSKNNHLITKLNARVIKSLPINNVQLWQVENIQEMDMKQLAESYQDHTDIEFIEPNYLYTASDVEVLNDPDFNQQWALNNTGELEGSIADADIDAPEGWTIQSESPSVVVGIIDTGVDWRHPDLIDNIWQNKGEDTDGDGVLVYENGEWIFDEDDENGIDDDGNGYIDDFIGWNFKDDNNQPFDYDAAEDGDYVQAHGTHVAGIIGASGNNGIGVTGVTHKVQLAVLKFLSDDPIPAGEAADAAKAIDYASKMNFQISNNSWGGSKKSNLIKGSIEKAAANNHLFIAAAGNGGEDKIGDDNDLQQFYPANYGFVDLNDYYYYSQAKEGLKNIISVANTDYADTLSTSSNFGINTVQIAAPGINIYSCLPFGYGWLSGTSMATPHVTGACALLWERGTELYDTVHYEMIKDWVINSADSLPALQANTISGGRLNLHQSLMAIEQPAYQDLYKNCRQRDSLTLSIIYDALNGDQWFPTSLNNGTADFYYDTWDLTQPMDTWKGVSLNSLGCVTHLNLSSKARCVYNYSTGYCDYIELPIKGQIPAEIGNLSELVELILDNNLPSNYQYDRIYEDSIRINGIISNLNLQDATGSLPSEIGKLSKLKTLILSGKLFGASIPPELGKLQQLNHLDLSGNNLTGSMPKALMNLPRLMSLNLSYNNLNGNIPEELYNLGSLQKLDLFANNLTEPIPDVFEQLDLKVLDLAYNNFNGNIPPSIGYMENLQFLLLEHNQLVGSIPPDFYNLWNLESESGFNVAHNQLSGCYDPYLAYIGSFGDMQFGYYNTYLNFQVSDGNNFDVPWEDFDEGACWATEVTKVWPGDFNNDGIVNQKDIVFYGFAEENVGPKREGPDTSNIGNVNWIGQLCPDWENQVLGINGKHQDADGNGVIDTSDYAVIIDNWGLENPDHRSDLDDLTYVSNGIELVLEPVEGFPVGTYDLYLKRAGNADTPVYGIAGEIKFSRPLSPDSKITFDDSCFASDSTYADFKFNLENTILEFGITQTDNINVVCEDALARIVVVIIVEEVGEGGDKFLKFKANGITSKANNQSGGDINQAIGSSMSQTLQAPSDNNFNMRVSANPQRCRVGGRATAYVSGGTRPYQYLWSTSDTTNKIINLEAGVYSVIVSDAEGLSDTLTLEIEDQQLPEYDENGELISCEIEIETNCANNIDFDKYITDENNGIVEQGFYAARKNIYTSGKIIENKEVDLQAGEEVILKPGFTMELNTGLNVIIQNCNEE